MQLHFRNFQTQKYAAEVNTKNWRRKREREENNNICFRESVASGKLWFANMWCTLSDTQTHILQPKLRTFIYFTTGGGAAAAEHTNDGELKSPLSFSPVRRIYYSFTAALWIQINQTKSTLVLFFFFSLPPLSQKLNRSTVEHYGGKCGLERWPWGTQLSSLCSRRH